MYLSSQCSPHHFKSTFEGAHFLKTTAPIRPSYDRPRNQARILSTSSVNARMRLHVGACICPASRRHSIRAGRLRAPRSVKVHASETRVPNRKETGPIGGYDVSASCPLGRAVRENFSRSSTVPVTLSES